MSEVDLGKIDKIKGNYVHFNIVVLVADWTEQFDLHIHFCLSSILEMALVCYPLLSKNRCCHDLLLGSTQEGKCVW
jgi:hypothetical protein